MSAPTIGGESPLETPWARKLLSLKPGWDSYDALPIEARALVTVARFFVVPRSNGGVELELQDNGWHIKISILPDGGIENIWWQGPTSISREPTCA